MAVRAACYVTTSSRPGSLIPFLAYMASACSAMPIACLESSNLGLALVQVGIEVQLAGEGSPNKRSTLNRSSALKRQAPGMSDVEQKLALANKTLEQIEHVLQYVNDTASGMVMEALQVVTTLLSTLDRAKTTAVSMQGTLGEDVVKTVAKIIDSLSPKLQSLSDVLTKSSGTIESAVNNILLEFSTLVAKVLKVFKVAIEKVDGLYDQTSLLQVKEEGPLGWLLGGSNKFSQARSAIRKANDTVAQLVTELDDLNTSVVDLLVSQIIEPVESALNRLSDAVDKAIVAAGDNLPSFLGDKVKSIITSALSLLDMLRSKLQPIMATIESQIEQAQAVAPQIYAASDALVGMVDQAEGTAGALQGTTQSSAVGLRVRCEILLVSFVTILLITIQ